MDANLKRSVSRIRRSFGSDLPAHALVLGSGFEGVTGHLRISACLSYRELPGFPEPGVEGHAGELLLAVLGELPLLVCRGRSHFYEGISMEVVMYATRVLAAAGVRKIVLTNAAGGINPRFRPGEFMLLSDHINFTGVNPLRGLPAAGGKCFVELGQAYSPEMRAAFRAAARREKIKLHEGVYLGVSGPSYETPAEIRAFRKWGADAVGMSTIPEVLMARYCGVEVAAISCITNLAAGMAETELCHDEVLAVGRESAHKASRLLLAFAGEVSKSAKSPKNV